MLVLFLIEFFAAKNEMENIVLFTSLKPYEITFICSALEIFMKRKNFTSKHIYSIDFTNDLYSKKESSDYKKFMNYLKIIQKSTLILKSKDFIIETNELVITSRQLLIKILYDKDVAFLIRMADESYVYIEMIYRNTVLDIQRVRFFERSGSFCNII